MCGIFGFVGKNDWTPHPERLKRIATTTEARGPHAFGLAWIDSRNRLRMYKQTGRITDHLGVLRMASDARMLIGHCRYATHGDARDNLNNHPHPVDGGWMVHNGVVRRHARINIEWDLHPISECDSETIALLIEALDGTVLERCATAAEICGPNFATAALWRNPNRMVLVRNGNPLHIGIDKRGLYFGSLEGGLPGARELDDHSAIALSVRKGEVIAKRRDLADVPILV